MSETTFLQRLPTFERRLDNGLTVIVRQDGSAPVVAVVTHVRAGYFDEPDPLAGISHVLEHMYFKGTARRGAGEIARETKEAGGYLNAGTIYDRTSYYTVLPKESLEQALDIQADALQHSAIDEDELRKELQVIIQEAKRKLDNPGAVAQETLFETMFDVHRMRRWRIGTEEVLTGFTRQHVWDYYRNLYRASNTILVIAGDVEPDTAFALADRYYGNMASGEPIRDAGAEEPARSGFRYREMAGDIAQSYMEWGWHTPGTLHADTPALDVLAIVLGQGRASRLYRHVRDAGAVASISAYNYTPTTLGVFGIGADLNPPDTARALELTAHTLRTVLEEGVTEQEAERARNILEARMLRRLETAEGQANLLADWQALGDWRLADDYLRSCMAVTPQQLAHVARTYLDPDALTVLLYRPRSSATFAGDPDRLRATLFGGAAGSAESVAGGATTDVAASAVVEPAADSRNATGVAAPARAGVARLEPVRVDGDVRFYDAGAGGARIVIRQRTTAPLVSLGLYCSGGTLAEREVTAGLTGLMARASLKGTASRSGVQLAEAIEALGGSISPGVSADMLDWSTSLPSRHLEAGVDLLLDAALHPTFPAEEAERERKIALSDLEQIRDDMQQYPLRLAFAAAFPDHPYGFGLEQLESAVRAADLGALTDWHRDRVRRGAPHVIVVGDVADPDVAAAYIAERLRGRLGEPQGLDTSPAGWGGAAERVERSEKAQTAIVLAFPGPPRNHDDVYPLEVLSSAISGLGGRLFEELRSRRSLAYSVSASPVPRWLGGAFIAYIGTAPEREEEARAALREELLRTAAEPLPAADIARAQRYMIGSWQIRQQTHSRQATDLAWALLLGRGLAELRDFPDRVLAVDAAAIQAAAARWLRTDDLIEAVVRGTGGGR
jgi:zinc protease